MVKYFCDACGKEIHERSYDIKVMKHITDINIGYSAIIGGKIQPISGGR